MPISSRYRDRRYPERQAEAKLRALVRESRSDSEQVQELDKRLGNGVGARKERARL